MISSHRISLIAILYGKVEWVDHESQKKKKKKKENRKNKDVEWRPRSQKNDMPLKNSSM